MSAKEIVKRLKDSLDYEFDLSFNDRKKLLSYIEKLEKEYKQLKDRNEINIDRNIEAYEIVEQLENNRDKAIEYIDNYLKREYFNYDILETNTIYNRDLFKVKNILKGDSDE